MNISRFNISVSIFKCTSLCTALKCTKCALVLPMKNAITDYMLFFRTPLLYLTLNAQLVAYSSILHFACVLRTDNYPDVVRNDIVVILYFPLFFSLHAAKTELPLYLQFIANCFHRMKYISDITNMLVYSIVWCRFQIMIVN